MSETANSMGARLAYAAAVRALAALAGAARGTDDELYCRALAASEELLGLRGRPSLQACEPAPRAPHSAATIVGVGCGQELMLRPDPCARSCPEV